LKKTKLILNNRSIHEYKEGEQRKSEEILVN